MNEKLPSENKRQNIDDDGMEEEDKYDIQLAERVMLSEQNEYNIKNYYLSHINKHKIRK